MANLTDADKVLRNDTGKSIATNIASIASALTPSNITDLGDVNLTNPITDGQVIKYDTATQKWVNGGTVNTADMMPMSGNDSTKVSEAIGDLSTLTTTDKSSIVGAINEIASYTPVYGNTASGSIATFDTSLALPLQDCTIAINAVQEGSGTPSPDNVRPITGFTECNVTRTGKNLFDCAQLTSASGWTESGGVYSGTIADLYAYAMNGFPIQPKWAPNQQYVFKLKVNNAEGYSRFRFVYTDNTYSELTISPLYQAGTYVSVTTQINKTVSNLLFTYYTGGYLSISEMSLELGTSASAFEAYNGNTYTVDFGQTVCGGLLDVTTGVLTVTHARVDLGSLTWTKNTSFTNTIFVATVSDKKTNNSNCLCTHYANGGIAMGATFLNNLANNNFASDTSNGIYIRDDSKASLSADDFKTAMSGVTLKYEVATPTEYTLASTPPISAIVGTNNVFTDTNGNTSVMYACSLKDYIEGQ